MATTHRTKGISLAKGPVGLVGLVLLAYGITALLLGGHGFAQHAPNGAVSGKTWLGLEVNGWSGLLFIAAGLALVLGARLHFTAKAVSLIVGLALGAIAVIAAVKGHGALGLFAANHVTELVWGAGAVLLVGVSLLPRVGGKTKARYDGPDERLPVTRQTDPASTLHARTSRREERPPDRELVTNHASTTTNLPQQATTTSAHATEDQHV